MVAKHEQADLCNGQKSSLKCVETLLKWFSVWLQAIIIAYTSIEVRFKNYFESYKAKHHTPNGKSAAVL